MSLQEDFICPDLVTAIELFVIVVVFCARDSGEETKMDMKKIILMIKVITVYFLLMVFNIITYH